MNLTFSCWIVNFITSRVPVCNFCCNHFRVCCSLGNCQVVTNIVCCITCMIYETMELLKEIWNNTKNDVRNG